MTWAAKNEPKILPVLLRVAPDSNQIGFPIFSHEDSKFKKEKEHHRKTASAIENRIFRSIILLFLLFLFSFTTQTIIRRQRIDPKY
jgi:hypothetical protein